MFRSRAERIVNLMSAILVLIGGLYVLIFMPVNLPIGVRIAVGFLLLVYFVWRLRYYKKKIKENENDTKSLLHG